MLKARIQEGYPKLGLYTIQNNYNHGFYFPKRSNGLFYWYRMRNNELIVIAGSVLDYLNNICYYFVPFKAIKDGTIPINSVLTWKQGHKNMPSLSNKHIQLLDTLDFERNGKNINKIFT